MLTDVFAVGLSVVAVPMSSALDATEKLREAYFEKKQGDKATAAGVELATRAFIEGVNEGDIDRETGELEFPCLKPYLRIVLYHFVRVEGNGEFKAEAVSENRLREEKTMLLTWCGMQQGDD